MKITEFDLKWVHMARYGLILRQHRAIWLRIISKPLLTPKGVIKDNKTQTKIKVCAASAKAFKAQVLNLLFSTTSRQCHQLW